VIINWRGRKNQDAAGDFTTGGADGAVAAAAAFDVFFLPVPEPFAIGS